MSQVGLNGALSTTATTMTTPTAITNHPSSSSNANATAPIPATQYPTTTPTAGTLISAYGASKGSTSTPDGNPNASSSSSKPVLVRKVMDVMRNMADILEFSSDGNDVEYTTTTSAKGKGKGKEREHDPYSIVRSPSSTSTSTTRVSTVAAANNLVSNVNANNITTVLLPTLRDELRLIREEIKLSREEQLASERRSREEIQALRLLHQAEVESLERRMKDMEERTRVEVRNAIEEGRYRSRDRDRGDTLERRGDSGGDVAAELEELKRRIMYLESQTQSRQGEDRDIQMSPQMERGRQRERSSSIASSSNMNMEREGQASGSNGYYHPHHQPSQQQQQQQQQRDWDRPPPLPTRHHNGFGSGFGSSIRNSPLNGGGGSASAPPSRRPSSVLGDDPVVGDGVDVNQPLPVRSQRKVMMALSRVGHES